MQSIQIYYPVAEDINIKNVKENLEKKGIFCGGGVYEVPCHLQPVFEEIEYDSSKLVNTEKFCPNHLCPPITSGTSSEDAARIAIELVNNLKK